MGCRKCKSKKLFTNGKNKLKSNDFKIKEKSSKGNVNTSDGNYKNMFINELGNIRLSNNEVNDSSKLYKENDEFNDLLNMQNNYNALSEERGIVFEKNESLFTDYDICNSDEMKAFTTQAIVSSGVQCNETEIKTELLYDKLETE